MSKWIAGVAGACMVGLFALTPAQAAQPSETKTGVAAGQTSDNWEVSDQRRHYRGYGGPRRYYGGGRRYYGGGYRYRPYYATPYYAYPRPYYRPYYRPAPFPFFPFF